MASSAKEKDIVKKEEQEREQTEEKALGRPIRVAIAEKTLKDQPARAGTKETVLEKMVTNQQPAFQEEPSGAAPDSKSSTQLIKWYERRLLDTLFERMKDAESFLGACVSLRASVDLQADGEGPADAAEVFRSKLVSYLQCKCTDNLSGAARKGDFDMMEGEILLEHFGYTLREAHQRVLSLCQKQNESLQEYTQRTENLWRGIRRVERVSKERLGHRLKAHPDEAVKLWTGGIRQPGLEEFVRQKFMKEEWGTGDWKELQKHYEEGRRWLERAAEIPSFALRSHSVKSIPAKPIPTPARGRQHQSVTVITPSSQPEDSSRRERQNQRQSPKLRYETMGAQRRDDETVPCEQCPNGIFILGKGCDNPLCESKTRTCNYCRVRSFQPGMGCSTPGCQANRKRRQLSGNGRARDL